MAVTLLTHSHQSADGLGFRLLRYQSRDGRTSRSIKQAAWGKGRGIKLVIRGKMRRERVQGSQCDTSELVKRRCQRCPHSWLGLCQGCPPSVFPLSPWRGEDAQTRPNSPLCGETINASTLSFMVREAAASLPSLGTFTAGERARENKIGPILAPSFAYTTPVPTYSPLNAACHHTTALHGQTKLSDRTPCLHKEDL
ncbi:uncharacterized [Tachysurus ichikawai]